jgi:hypothetical protein
MCGKRFAPSSVHPSTSAEILEFWCPKSVRDPSVIRPRQPALSHHPLRAGIVRLRSTRLALRECDLTGQGTLCAHPVRFVHLMERIPIRVSKPWSSCPWSRWPSRNSAWWAGKSAVRPFGHPPCQTALLRRDAPTG